MPENNSKTKPKTTSWENVGGWYNSIVGDDGHYYHQKIILPGVLKLLGIEKGTDCALLDLACGQGVLARQLPVHCLYTGIDISPTLIKAAKSTNKNPRFEFVLGDTSKTLPIKKQDFTHAAIILALQNIEAGDQVLLNAARHLQKGGKFVIVLNHPCFRIPRQSSWGIEEEKKLQYRRIDRYQTEMKIPIQANPSKGGSSEATWSFHHPLSTYSKWIKAAGFVIDSIDEWCSDKTSTGKNAKMENRSREEFPLFMAITCVKN
ncbi:MAG: class I SAM-dependent methyltransferase [Parachlamydiaceae bacterium]|nr:class I SAM-dependent methyltransferase [Parachlamydiaceae bacterium]